MRERIVDFFAGGGGASARRARRADSAAFNGARIENRPGGDLRQHHKPWLCIECGRRFRNDQGARHHWVDVHSKPPQKDA